ncbi:MAG: hypothetical protein JST91_07015 [Actinobacteria bacterium]|nr:hypothetical protein [Actinomycetota bacterium]
MRPLCCAALIAAAGLLAGCSSTAPAPEPSPTSDTAPASGHGALAQCLSEHGVPAAPGPSAGPPPGVDAATWDDAMRACSTLAPGPA